MNTRDIRKNALAELDEDTRDLANVESFCSIAVPTFDQACLLVKGRSEHSEMQFASLSIRLLVYAEKIKTLSQDESFADWPGVETSFGEYHRCGSSAMHTALLFIDTVVGAIECAKVISVGVSSVYAIDQDSFATWQQAFVRELEQETFSSLHQWPMSRMRRDGEKLMRAMNRESEDFLRHHGKYAALLKWIPGNVKGKQETFLRRMIEQGGKVLCDESLCEPMGWAAEKVYQGARDIRDELNKKFGRTHDGQPWKIEYENKEASLVPVVEK
tara:strand:- start:58833 stop:59648 length:816 start_codon:yes stop_codon:yes gene_type:complete